MKHAHLSFMFFLGIFVLATPAQAKPFSCVCQESINGGSYNFVNRLVNPEDLSPDADVDGGGELDNGEACARLNNSYAKAYNYGTEQFEQIHRIRCLPPNGR